MAKFCINYLNQSTNRNEGLSGRSQGLFPPRPQAREKTLGTRLIINIVLRLRMSAYAYVYVKV